MKYLKLFEDINKEPEIGQYILAEQKLWSGKQSYTHFDDWANFLNNNIGVIIDKANNFGTMVYLVRYDNMPKSIDDWLKIHGSRDNLFDRKKQSKTDAKKYNL